MPNEFQDQLQETLGDAYILEREIGGGGMSRVFLATERALSRSVVVKVLPPDMAGHLSAERFKREISIAARLQHAHIVALLAAGGIDGRLWFTMPFVEGESLRERLSRSGELPLSDAVRMLREIASALAYAHAHQVVHRDIKPENILLSGGAAMVTDFGVAKAVSASTLGDTSSLTDIGVALGTPAYMAPEQASADPMVDHRADIYAWGVVAYELLTGQPPFAGRTAQAVIAAHITETPETITRRRATIPPALGQLVMRALEKRPADRPQSADEIIRTLDAVTTPDGGMPASSLRGTRNGRLSVRARAIAAGVVATLAVVTAIVYFTRHRAPDAGDGINAIAVLPFENLGGDTTYDYLAEGLSDEVRSALTGVRGMSVKARASSVAFRGHDVNLKDVGAKLGVGAVLGGTVRRTGTRMKVTAELARVSDGVAVWSHTFDEEASNLAGVRDSIARGVARASSPRADAGRPAVAANGATRGTTDFETYNLFLKAEYYRRRFAFAAAIPLLQQAVARDPNFARGFASLADAYAALPITGFGAPDSSLALAERNVTRALELDSALGAAHNARARILTLRFQFAQAVAELRQMVAQHPDDEDAHASLALSLGSLGHLDEALTEARIAERLDPLSINSVVTVQYVLLSLRRYRETIAATKAVMDLDPRSILGLGNLTLAYTFLGEPDSAIMAAERGLAIDTTFGSRSVSMFAFAAGGRWADAAKQRTLADKEGGNSPHFNVVIGSLVFGEWDAALSAMERGVRAHEPLFVTVFLSCDPLFDPLKSKPRFDALMREMGLSVCPAHAPWPITPSRR